MFYVVKKHDLHVVEDTSVDISDSDEEDYLPTREEVEAFSACSVVDLTKNQPNNPATSVDVSSDSDVEIVHPISSFGQAKSAYRPPARAKRSNNQPVSPAASSKRH
jgi:hypothetical protein